MIYIIIIIWIIMLLIMGIVWMSQLVSKLVYGLFFFILNLGFLPTGYDIAKNIKPTGVYVIPFIGAIIEVPLHFFMTLWINIVDFICWLPSKIPLISSALKFIDKCPDLDLTTHGVDPLIEKFGLTGHRNFVTHSILNPYILIILVIGTVLYLLSKCISKKIKNIIIISLSLCLAVFSAHLFADCMPNAWLGGALIKAKIFGKSITFNAFISKLWLFVNGLAALRVSGFYASRLGEEDLVHADNKNKDSRDVDSEKEKIEFEFKEDENIRTVVKLKKK